MFNLPYKKKSLEELIVLAQQSDSRAIEALIKACQKNVYTTLSYLVSNKSEVYDLTQNVLIKIAKNIKSLRSVEKFNTWLNRIISNVYYDELRKNKKYKECLSIEDEECQEIKDTKTPIEKCINSEIDKIVKNSILELPTHFKIAIILREFAGLSYQEIADITQAGLGTVKSRIARARAILQDQLKNCI